VIVWNSLTETKYARKPPAAIVRNPESGSGARNQGSGAGIRGQGPGTGGRNWHWHCLLPPDSRLLVASGRFWDRLRSCGCGDAMPVGWWP